MKYLIHSSGHPFLNIESCREYLESKAEFSRSMRNSNLIHSDLSASVPSTLSILFILETKGMGEEKGGLQTVGDKIAEYLKIFYIHGHVQIDLGQQKCRQSALC
jgi:hypothetical protein